MKEKPTTFQLAQLAAQAASSTTRPKDAVRRAWDLWKEAEMEIAEHDNRVAYLRSLFSTPNGKDIPIFTDSPEDWRARLEAYPGDPGDVARAMWQPEFPNEEVQRQLFRDKTLGRDTRRTLFLGLARLCILYDMEGPSIPHAKRLEYLGSGNFVDPTPGFPIHPKNLEMAKANYRGAGKMQIPAKEVDFMKTAVALLSKPKLYAHLVRWAGEIRQKQLALAKTRVIPESVRVRHDPSAQEDSIQYRRTYRQ